MRRLGLIIVSVLAVLMWASFALACSTLDQEIAKLEASTQGRALGHLYIDVAQKSENEVALYAATQVANNGFIVLFIDGCATDRYSVPKSVLKPIIPPNEWLKLTRKTNQGNT